MINHQTLRRVPEFFRQTHMFCFIIEFGQSPNLRSFRSPNLSCFSNAARIGRLGLCDASDALRSKRERGRSSNSRLANREPWQQTGIDIYHMYVSVYVCMYVCDAMPCHAMQCNAMQRNAMQCNAMQCMYAYGCHR